MRIAHLSDLHFSKFSISPRQFFSKRWLGSLNLLANRLFEFDKRRPFSLIKLLGSLGVTHVIITGDLTTTSLKKEYDIAKSFADLLKDHGIDLFIIPGNHDHYTRSAYREKRFYDYFPSQFSHQTSFNLKDHGVMAYQLKKGWTIVGMDTTLATSLSSSHGFFSEKLEDNLSSLLDEIPDDEKIILINHFPFFPSEKPRHSLVRGEALQKVIESRSNIVFYLHGHTHRSSLADLRGNGLPIILDSGSVSHKRSSWNLLDFSSRGCEVSVYQIEKNSWKIVSNKEFLWNEK